jgi:CRISPR-associated protein Csd1
MLLERWMELRERLDDELPAPYHKRAVAAWALVLSEQGEFVGWQSRDVVDDLPDSGRTSGVYAHLFADKLEYLFGLRREELDGYVKTGAELNAEGLQGAAAARSAGYLAASVQRVEEFIAQQPQGAGRERFGAALKFLRDDAQRFRALEALVKEGHKLKESDLIALQVGATTLHTQPESRAYWEAVESSKGESGATIQGECILCGEHRPIVSLHAKLPLQGSSGALVSANMKAFESYGLEKSQIAPTCQRCARRYGEAAIHLLKNERHRYTVGPVTYIFWTRDPKDEFAFLETLQNPDEEQVKRVISSPFKPRNAEELEADAFYAAALSMNMSRPVVRDWVETTVPAVQAALKAWFDGMALWDLHGERSKPHGVYALASSTVFKVDQLSPRVIPALVSAALYGQLLGPDLLARALQRVGADPKERWTRPRMALIRLIVNDTIARRMADEMSVDGAARVRRQDYINDERYKERLMGEELNESEQSAAYLCGRLFATLEEAQRQAVPGINATIADRFFGTASTAPASVFGRLLRGAQAHTSKLERDNKGAYLRIQDDMNAIMPGIRAFPRTLTLMEQGVFALGYYHQRAANSKQMKERSAAKKERELAAAAAKADNNG